MKARTDRPADKHRTKAARLFSENLKRICKQQNLDPTTLAARSGKSVATVRRMLAGDVNPDLKLMQELADGLGIPIVELLRGI